MGMEQRGRRKRVRCPSPPTCLRQPWMDPSTLLLLHGCAPSTQGDSGRSGFWPDLRPLRFCAWDACTWGHKARFLKKWNSVFGFYHLKGAQSLWGGRACFLSVFGLKGSGCWKRFIDFLGGHLVFIEMERKGRRRMGSDVTWHAATAFSFTFSERGAHMCEWKWLRGCELAEGVEKSYVTLR